MPRSKSLPKTGFTLSPGCALKMTCFACAEKMIKFDNKFLLSFLLSTSIASKIESNLSVPNKNNNRNFVDSASRMKRRLETNGRNL